MAVPLRPPIGVINREMIQSELTQTGVATLHDLLGGALPGRIHLLTGAPGSGKTSACLHFLRTGILKDERVAMVTLDRPSDLQSHARLLGHDLRASVRDGQLTLMRYDSRFTPRIAAAASPATIIRDLEQLLTLSDLQQMRGHASLRIAIDPISPFLAEGVATGAALSTLVNWLEEVNATALLTWTGDISVHADRRVERLLERAAVIVNLERLGGGTFRAEVIRARHAIANTPPVQFEIRSGSGLAAIAPAPPELRRDHAPITQSVLLGPLTPVDDRRLGDDKAKPPS
jgi:KaiC/GvpD/RAD55 family RecA-like ATPase